MVANHTSSLALAPRGGAKPAGMSSDSWWLFPRHARPSRSRPTPESQRVATALKTHILNAPEKSSRALAHVVWALASWADRMPTAKGWRVQVTQSYVEIGASVGRRPAEWALHSFGKWTGCTPGWRGWWKVDPVAMEAVWQALDWLIEQGLLHRPVTKGEDDIQRPIGFAQPSFTLSRKLTKETGSTRCGCGAHRNGDRSPSMAYNLNTGRGTCMVSGRVYALEQAGADFRARFLRQRENCGGEHTVRGTIINCVPSVGWPVIGPATGDVEHAAELAGEPGPEPSPAKHWGIGLITQRLSNKDGEKRVLSKTSSRERWVRLASQRWGNKKQEQRAENAIFYDEIGKYELKEHMPDRLVGVGRWRIVPGSIYWIEGKTRSFPVFDIEEYGTRHVLFDIDGCEVGEKPIAGAVEAIRQTIENQAIFSKVTWITRTSSQGLQVLAELRRFRFSPKWFYASPAVKTVLRAAGARLVAILGGHNDERVWRPSSMARAPGWRVRVKNGRKEELAALWYSADPALDAC